MKEWGDEILKKCEKGYLPMSSFNHFHVVVSFAVPMQKSARCACHLTHSA